MMVAMSARPAVMMVAETAPRTRHEEPQEAEQCRAAANGQRNGDAKKRACWHVRMPIQREEHRRG